MRHLFDLRELPCRAPVATLAALFTVFTLACSDSGGSSPSEPRTPPVNIEGLWEGTTTSVASRGTCLANNFGPLTVSARWNFRQTGDSFTADLTVNNAVTCPYRGTIRGNSVNFFAVSSGARLFCFEQSRRCPNNRSQRIDIRLDLDRPVLTATVTGDTMIATGTSYWIATDPRNGQSLGTYEVDGRQSLTRQ